MNTKHFTRGLSHPFKLTNAVIKFANNILQKKDTRSIAKTLVQDIQTLGPLYIKAGQFVSSRKDVFGKEVTEEFSLLRDNIVPLERDEVYEILKQSGMLSLFSHINYKPLASASIGQVHVGVLKETKQKVIIKVKRPFIDQELKEQLKVLTNVVDLMEALRVENTDETKKLLHDFEAVIIDEIDFDREASNLAKFYELYKDDKKVLIPKVNKNLCTENVIIMEYIESDDILSYTGDRRKLAKSIMELFVDQLLFHGIMHGDPHPGNVRIAKDGSLVIYDFGNVLLLSNSERQQLKELICQLVIGNTNGVINTMKKIGIKVDDEKSTRVYINKYMEYMKTIDIQTFRETSTSGNVKLPMRINNTLVRIIRIFGMIEGTCKELDPNFNYFDLLENYVDTIFIDDEFLLYKITSDTQLLFNNMMMITTNDLTTPEDLQTPLPYLPPAPQQQQALRNSNALLAIILGMVFDIFLLINSK